MKHRLEVALVASATLLCLFVAQPVFAQTCDDDEMIATQYKKSILELVEKVKKESLEDFQRAYHQKSCMSNLTLCLTAVDGLIKCLDKAAQDPAATKEQVDAYKAKQASYTRLKGKVEEQRNALKAAEDAKAGKALIEKIDLST